ncbi:hypothetical protein [Hyphomicrobium sulfonivorans]|uniref:hypothetical protein n=1 Tax=Hyphomicrobium sulfonivorans TaxID=121290 RepID=UPI00156D59F6|nr:hypothetical protein [Hyphomicrobium sulfonivorans]MBI1649871.1 hypothetical protein [Hyphomicrobium sulfonivorans]NSL71782.1 hypothetical protein [Hyphomicrobium sulfonivorans]
MSSMWKRLDAATGRAVSRVYGERVAVRPKIESEYSEAPDDPLRDAKVIRGVFGLEHDTEDLRGQRLKGEFAGVGRLAVGAAHVLVSAAEYAGLGYDLQRGDVIAFPDQSGVPSYRVVVSHPLDCGDRFVILSVD